jgi:hypothetical protein
MEAGKIYRLKPSTVAVLKSPALVKKIGCWEFLPIILRGFA